MTATTRRTSRSLLLPVLVPLMIPVTILVLLLGLGTASAAQAPTTGRVAGAALDPAGRGLAGISVRVFELDASGGWMYRTTVAAGSRGGYGAEGLSPGRYVLQFVDTRPAHDKNKRVTTDVRTTVRAGRTTVTDAVLRRGAWLWGSVRRTGGTAARQPLVTAVRDGDTSGTVHTVRADRSGRYALGGLPTGRYTVFVDDRARRHTAAPKRVRLARLGRSAEVSFVLRTRAGRYTGRITAGGAALKQRVHVTLVNRTTGQFRVVELRGGDLGVLRGLSPGSYRLTVPGVGRRLGTTFRLPPIRAGRVTSAGTLDLSRQGGTLHGTVIDAETSLPLRGVSVTVMDKYGHPFETVTTTATGVFDVGGSIPDGDNPVTIRLEARNPVDDVRYARRDVTGLQVRAGSVADLGTVALSRQ